MIYREFQFLIGRVKRSELVRPGSDVFFVSIPYRQSQKYVNIDICEYGYIVSIPYRQSQKFYQTVGKIEGESVLIPYRQSQKVDNLPAYTNLFVMFQFLIGRVKSLNIIIQDLHKNLFQFLIGRVKSSWEKYSILYIPLVSIPYRQSQKNE